MNTHPPCLPLCFLKLFAFLLSSFIFFNYLLATHFLSSLLFKQNNHIHKNETTDTPKNHQVRCKSQKSTKKKNEYLMPVRELTGDTKPAWTLAVKELKIKQRNKINMKNSIGRLQSSRQKNIVLAVTLWNSQSMFSSKLNAKPSSCEGPLNGDYNQAHGQEGMDGLIVIKRQTGWPIQIAG